MVRVLPGIGLKGFWGLGFDGWDSDNDINLLKASVLSQAVVLSRLAAVPGAPVDGDIHILTVAPNLNAIAVRDNGAWVYFSPATGWRAYVVAEDCELVFTGSTWRRLTSEISAFFGGTPAVSALVHSHFAIRATDLPVTLAGSFAKLVTSPSSAIAFDLKKNGAPIGSVDFAASATTATFSFASAVALAAGDILTIHSPANLFGAADLTATLKVFR